jgi:uncharacterized membrane protein
MASAEPTGEPTTRDPKRASILSGVIERNIRALIEVRRQEQRRERRQERMADAITAFTDSMPFVYLHAMLFGAWIVVNLGILPIKPFDPTFIILAIVASVEAIFLSTFVLISQNRMQAAADRRADLDLQITLLAEHEITRMIQLIDAIAHRMGIETPDGLEELKQEVKPEAVLEEIEAYEHEMHRTAPPAPGRGHGSSAPGRGHRSPSPGRGRNRRRDA